MRGFRIGSAFGIPIRLNWTFLIVLPLFAAFIAWDITELVLVINETFTTTIDSEQLTSGYLPWILGLASALGLFAGVLLHEFGHSLVALRYGYEIDSITLWLLGGVASFTEFPEDWQHELVIAIAGPIVSVLIGIGSYVAFVSLPSSLNPARFVFGYLTILNIVLAAFNLLPGFPMDGGRILRAILARNQPHARATQQAASVGKVFAFMLGLLGLFTNLFLVLLAFFIYIAASGEAQQISVKAAFEGVTVEDVMTHKEDLETVTGDTSITDLVARMFNERHIGYPVVRNGDLIGMVTLDDAGAIEEVERDAFRVEDVMSTDIKTIAPDADAMEAFQQMQQNGVGRLPVVDETGNLVGIISRTDLMRAFNVIQKGGLPRSVSQSEAEISSV
ncbi:CBS domain-containing protein [Salinirubellus sp. GCM10025818]|uniref:CBS domain-containing protein n=1 Tax=Salinirubellus TaxID=2162630 RepID=UPI0030D62255